MSRASLDLDRLAELEEEQRFLLRSLADLDREHAAGDVDEVDYATLRDGYTARAATVLRAIDEGRGALPTPRRRNPWVVVGWIVGVLAIAVGAGIFVARSSGQNLSESPTAVSGELDDDDVAQLLSQARSLLAAEDNQGAFTIYSAILQQSPDDVEANTYAAWLLVLDASSLGTEARSQRASQGLALLQHATDVDPAYPDAHCFAGIVAARFLDPPDLERGRSEAQACLDSNPPGEIRGMVEGFLAGLDAAATSTTP